MKFFNWKFPLFLDIYDLILCYFVLRKAESQWKRALWYALPFNLGTALQYGCHIAPVLRCSMRRIFRIFVRSCGARRTALMSLIWSFEIRKSHLAGLSFGTPLIFFVISYITSSILCWTAPFVNLLKSSLTALWSS